MIWGCQLAIRTAKVTVVDRQKETPLDGEKERGFLPWRGFAYECRFWGRALLRPGLEL